jgi:hypothetical protein
MKDKRFDIDPDGNFWVEVKFYPTEMNDLHRYTMCLYYLHQRIIHDSNVIDNTKSPLNSKEEALSWAQTYLNHYTTKINKL